MLNKLLVALFGSLLLGIGSTANAVPTSINGVTNNNWFTSATFSDGTRLDFLDFSSSSGHCFSCGHDWYYFENGYTYLDGSNWRLATLYEVVKLIGLVDADAQIEYGRVAKMSDPQVAELLALLGTTTYRMVAGWTSTPHFHPDYPNWAHYVNIQTQGGPDYAWKFSSTDPMTRTYFATSAWLVRNSITIPEPASLILLGIGLASLGVIRRKKTGCRSRNNEVEGGMPKTSKKTY